MNASTSHLTQKRKSAAGFAQGNFLGDRAGSSATTHKLEFGQKSMQGQNMGGMHINLEDDGRITDQNSLLDGSLDILPDIREGQT